MPQIDVSSKRIPLDEQQARRKLTAVLSILREFAPYLLPPAPIADKIVLEPEQSAQPRGRGQ